MRPQSHTPVMPGIVLATSPQWALCPALSSDSSLPRVSALLTAPPFLGAWLLPTPPPTQKGEVERLSASHVDSLGAENHFWEFFMRCASPGQPPSCARRLTVELLRRATQGHVLKLGAMCWGASQDREGTGPGGLPHFPALFIVRPWGCQPSESLAWCICWLRTICSSACLLLLLTSLPPAPACHLIANASRSFKFNAGWQI